MRVKVNTLGRTFSLEWEFDPHFPYVLPEVRLTERRCFGFIPHIEPDGKVCYLDRQESVVDPKRAGQVIKECFDLVIKTLEASTTGKNRQDFLKEFASYWCLMPNLVKGYFSLINTPLSQITLLNGIKTNRGYFITEEETGIQSFFKNIGARPASKKKEPWACIPLPYNKPLYPPDYEKELSIVELREMLLSHLNEKEWEILKSALTDKPRAQLLIQNPIGEGDHYLLGFRFDQPHRNAHPLFDDGFKGKPTPVVISPVDHKSLANRGGAFDCLGHSSVLVVGCGAIGGALSMQLAQTGIGRLTLVDPDKLMPENIYRHVLGWQQISKHKAGALKKLISRQMPHVKAEALNCKIEDLLNRPGWFSAFDAIVVATGSPNLNRLLNGYFLEKCPGKPVVYTWLDPYGIGGHTLVTNNGNTPSGCYACLYTDPDSGIGHNKASFAAPGQSFHKTQSGCDGLFIPYSTLDAQQTAIQATRTVVKLLLGELQGNPLLSWKGNGETFLKAGYSPSDRFTLSQEKINGQEYLYSHKNCPVCSYKVLEETHERSPRPLSIHFLCNSRNQCPMCLRREPRNWKIEEVE
ncbi:MAG: ThiF family adenylyltransferase [Phaeodactylibacter sp.]|nr:ThiF family adenylyltransferase [Phaeodactylibacter sp.]